MSDDINTPSSPVSQPEDDSSGLTRREFIEETGKLAVAFGVTAAIPPQVGDLLAFAFGGPPPGALVVDDKGGNNGRFSREGPPDLWWERPEDTAIGGQYVYTYNTDTPPSPKTNWATWTTAPLVQAGQYHLYAYIPLNDAQTTGALYQITYKDGQKRFLEISQIENHGKWVDLGTYEYAAGERGQVYLDDIVPETRFASTRIAYDAVVWLPPGVTWDPPANLIKYDPRWAFNGLLAYIGRGGEPVSTATGSFYTQHQDLFVPGRGLNVEFKRSYNSLDDRSGAFGTGWSYTYGMSAKDRGNGEIIVTLADGRAGLYVPNGSGYARPKGFLADLEKDGSQYVLTDVDGKIYTFRDSGDLTRITDLNANSITLAYDKQGYTLTDTVGRTFRVDWDDKTQIRSIVDPIGRTYTFEYDDVQLTVCHDAEGGTIRYGYDDEHRITSVTDPNGRTFVTNHYDGQGRVDWQKDASGSTTTFAYQDNPRRTTVVDNCGNSTVHEYDDKYRLIKETDAFGFAMQYEYDDDNNRTYIKDRMDHETRLKYDNRGNVLQIRDALNQTADFIYTSLNKIERKTDFARAVTQYEYDGRGNLLLVRDAENGESRMTYDGYGLLRTAVNPNGKQTEFTYDPHANLRTMKDATGAVTQYESDGVGRRISMTDAKKHTVRFVYDKNDRVRELYDAKGRKTFFVYDAVGNLKSVTDRRNYPTAYEYDENDSLVKITNARGHAAYFTYDRMYHRQTYTNRRGFKTLYEYDRVYNLVKVTDAKSRATWYEYDADRNLKKLTDALNHATQYEYDPLHRLSKMVDARNGETRYIYDAMGRIKSLQDPKGGVTVYDYDRLGRLVKLTDALQQVTEFGYDPAGNRTSLTNARHFQTLFQYDEANRLRQQTDPEGHVTRMGYDPVGNLAQLTNPRGFVTRFEYDENDNLTQVLDALTNTIQYGYDEEDNRKSVTNQNNHTTQFTFDEIGNLKTVQLPRGQTTRFDYDENSNRIAVVNAKTKVTRFGYDQLDLLHTQTNPLTWTTVYDYDELRRMIKRTDAESHATQYRYDELGRLTHVVDAKGYTTEYGYDELGNLTSFVDANSARTVFEVDLLGRVQSETNPLQKTWRYEYDPVGNRYQRQDAQGAVTKYTFDKDDRLTRITYPSGPAVEMVYDENHNLVNVADGSGSDKFVYDELDRLISAQRLTGILKDTLTGYRYDRAGNRVQVVYPDRVAMKYTYDDNEWLATAMDPHTAPAQYKYTRDAVGLPTRIDYPNQTWAELGYDDADQLKHLFNGKRQTSSDLISSFDYDLDNVGNRKHTIEKYTRGQVVTWDKKYEYDELYRLTSAIETPDRKPFQQLTSTFTYDRVGNRKSQTTNISDKPDTFALPKAKTTNYDYEWNRLIAAGSTKFVYDNNGNRLSMRGAERAIDFAYDFENRLVKAQTFDVLPNGKLNDDSLVDFIYDGLGRRRERGVQDKGVRKTGDFVYDALGYDLLAEYVDPGSPRTTNYYRDPQRVLSRRELQDLQNATKGAVPANAPMASASGASALASNTPAPTRTPVPPRAAGSNQGDQTYQIFIPGVGKDIQVPGGANNPPAGAMVTPSPTPIVAPPPLDDPVDSGGGHHYFHHYDGLNNVSAWSNHVGSDVHWYRYAPYGWMIDNNGADNSSTQTQPHNFLTYNGKMWDQETELLHYGARDYDPRNGVWTTQDIYRGRPREPMSLHRYMYVYDNPINLIDRFGFDGNSIDPYQSISSSYACKKSQKMIVAGPGNNKNKCLNGGTLKSTTPNDDITQDFLDKLKESAQTMKNYWSFGDIFTGAWMIHHNWTRSAIREVFKNLTDEDINLIPDDVLNELEANPLKFEFFSKQVRQNGPWDYKEGDYKKYESTGVVINGMSYKVDLTGNLAYGYAGRAAGFSPKTLEMMAGLAQKNRGTSKPEWTWEKSYFDDPRDQEITQAGINLYEKNGLNIDPQKLDKVIKSYACGGDISCSL